MATAPPPPDTVRPSDPIPPTAAGAPADPPSGWWAQLHDRLGRWARPVISAVLVLVAFLFAGRVFAALSGFKTDPDKKEVAAAVFNVKTFTVQPHTYREIVSGFGEARADRQVAVAAEVAGKVIATHPNLEVGAEVDGPGDSRDADGRTGASSTGELLVSIDPANYQQRVEQLQRQLDSDDVQLRQLDAEEANTQRLIESQRKTIATSREELESQQKVLASRAGNRSAARQAELSLQAAEDALVRLQNELSLYEVREESIRTAKAGREAELRTAQLDVERSEVRAPFPGQLSQVSVELGQYVRPGDMLVELTDLDHIEVPVALSQSQFERVEPLLLAGERPRVELADNETAEPRWFGQLVRAAPVADSSTRTVNVYVEVENAEQSQPLLPGTFVHARIEGPLLKEVLMVPRDAVVQKSVFTVADRDAAAITDDDGDDNGDSEGKSEESRFEVTVPDDAKVAVRQPVEVERTIQTFALVSGGLEPGTAVIMTNLDRLTDRRSYVRPQSELGIAEELDRQRIEALRLVE